MTLLAASGRPQIAIKYCTKVCKMGAAGKELSNSATVWQRITKFYTDIHADLVYTHIGYVRLYHALVPTIAMMAKDI